MSINIIVGGGIFAGPQAMTQIAGNFAFMGWLLAALMVFPIVWGVARASFLFPGEGGFYNYVNQGLGENWGFFAQWSFFLGYMLGTGSAMAFLLRHSFANRLGWTFAAEHPWATNALFIFIFALLNMLPVGLVSRIQANATVLKLTPLFVVLALGFFYLNPITDYNVANLENLPSTLPIVIFGFLGFEACCALSHLLEDGPQSLGKVALTAFGIVAVLYMTFHFGVLQIMGKENLAAHGPIAFPDYLGLSPQWTFAMVIIIGAAIILSFANSLFGVSLSNITNLVTMTKVSKPLAAAIQGLIMWLVLCWVSHVEHIFSFSVVGVGTAYMLTMISAFRKSLERKEHFEAAIMVLGFLSCIALYYYCWIGLGGAVL
ncbi:MAG: APC family permease, partial [Deltaproteobacteria bacterium]|nr:APC family permease [Deltaproteobacteria bacterium]